MRFGAGPRGSRPVPCFSAGYFYSSNLVAVMGASGGGKSSLLEIIAGRRTMGRATGDVIVNGVPLQSCLRWFQHPSVSQFVQQHDVLNEGLTVLEEVLLAARRRLPPGTSSAECLKKALEALHLMELSHRLDTKIGSGGGKGGISGGERRRVSVAKGILTNPRVLMLDEPTSGLDAASALLLVRIFKRIALRGCCVLCIIHQPRLEAFNLFDKVVALGAGTVA